MSVASSRSAPAPPERRDDAPHLLDRVRVGHDGAGGPGFARDRVCLLIEHRA
jgi:hypothetical protein